MTSNTLKRPGGLGVVLRNLTSMVTSADSSAGRTSYVALVMSQYSAPRTGCGPGGAMPSQLAATAASASATPHAARSRAPGRISARNPAAARAVLDADDVEPAGSS